MSGAVSALVVDDDRAVRKALEVNLTKHGLEVTLAETADQGLALLHDAAFDLLLTDVKMPGSSGMELLQVSRAAWPDMPVVVMTGYGSVQDAVAAMKAGAADYLIKPVSKDQLIVVIDRALEQRSLRAELQALRRQVEDRYGFESLVGATPVMVALYDEVAAVADTTATVLLQGPTGTGKELLAHAIHFRSRRAQAPFVRVNCSAIPEALLESELYGHERGSFTGAIRQHRGMFEQADGGTLLLDEIGELDPSMQVKLLRVLESGEIHRIGGNEPVKVDVRVIAATNKDLRREVRDKRFREDLFWRLNVVAIRVPPLRERKEDIPLLVDYFLARFAAKNERPVPRLARGVMDKLVAYDWPGNVRQLEHLIERTVILNRSTEIRSLLLPMDEELTEHDAANEVPVLPPPGTTLQEWLLRYEREVIVTALRQAGGVQARAARRLGLSRSNMNYRITRLGIALRDIDYGP